MASHGRTPRSVLDAPAGARASAQDLVSTPASDQLDVVRDDARPVTSLGAHCTGSGTCIAELHVHGCYADHGTCDDPADPAHCSDDPAYAAAGAA